MEGKSRPKQRALNNALPLTIWRDDLPVFANENAFVADEGASHFKKAIPVPVIKSVPQQQNPASYMSGFRRPDHYIKFHLSGGADAAHGCDTYDLTDGDTEWLYTNYICKGQFARDLNREQMRDIELIKLRTGFDVPESGSCAINLLELFEKSVLASNKSSAQLDRERLEIFSETRMEDLIAYFETEAYALAPLKVADLPEFPEAAAVVGAVEFFKSKYEKLDAFRKYEKFKTAQVVFVHDLYKYWIKKRQRMGKALIRRFQIPPDPNDLNPFVAFRPREVKRHATTRSSEKKVSEQMSTLNAKQYQKMRQLKQDGERIKLILNSLQFREELKLERTALSVAMFDLRLGNETEFGRQHGLSRQSMDDKIQCNLPPHLSNYQNLIISTLPKPNLNFLNQTVEKLANLKADAKRLKLVPSEWTIEDRKLADEEEEEDGTYARPNNRLSDTFRSGREDSDAALIDQLLNPALSFYNGVYQIPPTIAGSKRVDDSTIQMFSDLETTLRTLQSVSRPRNAGEIGVREAYEFEQNADAEIFEKLELRYNKLMGLPNVAAADPLIQKWVSISATALPTLVESSQETDTNVVLSPAFYRKQKKAWESTKDSILPTESSVSELIGVPFLSSLSYPLVVPSDTGFESEAIDFGDFGESQEEADTFFHGAIRHSRLGPAVDFYHEIKVPREPDPFIDEPLERLVMSDCIIEELGNDAPEDAGVLENHKRKMIIGLEGRTKRSKLTPPSLIPPISPLPLYNSDVIDALRSLQSQPILPVKQISNLFLTSSLSSRHLIPHLSPVADQQKLSVPLFNKSPSSLQAPFEQQQTQNLASIRANNKSPNVTYPNGAFVSHVQPFVYNAQSHYAAMVFINLFDFAFRLMA